MPWLFSSNLTPPLTPSEREEVAEGRAIIRERDDGFVVVGSRSALTRFGVVTGVGVTYGPNGEDAFFHSVKFHDSEGFGMWIGE